MTNLAEQLKAVDTQVAVIAAANVQKVNGAPNPMADILAELTRLKAENESLRTAKASSGTISLKVSEKGAVSVYGMGRFPVTLYREQWEKLLAQAPKIRDFINANAAGLSTKPVK
jgi:hypothetical protein